MKNLKKVLALVLAVVMIMGTVAVASAKDFKDVKATDNYAKAIDVLSNLGIIDGFTDGEYKPEGYFTRAQAAKMVAIVHNAATNGKIKGQDGISALYGNAQNAFTDCTGNWAVAYINYCRATGLLDGITRTTYAPNSKLTGVQWLKLMLTTLNFDTSKEGYLGAGWDIHVLNRANEIGLLDGLADGWKGDVPVTRGEAAQILYNTLTAYLVEYGQMIKGYKTPEDQTHPWNASFVSNEQVNKTGFMLAQKMGVAVTRTTDAFRRPGYTWSYGSWTGFYMDTPKAEYKTYATMCDVLKVMGVGETNGTKVVNLNGWVNGVVKDPAHPKATQIGTKMGGETKTVNGVTLGTALNYYAIDGYKVDSIALQHQKNKSCQGKNYDNQYPGWKTNLFGGQGDLTQVFKTEDGWVITTVHTFLAKVDDVKTLNRKDHATAANAQLKVWIECKDEPSYDENYEAITKQKEIDSTEFAKGSYVLVTMSHKKDEVQNNGEKRNYNENAGIIDVVAPETKVGKLTGASDLHYPLTVSIDGTQYNANCRFVEGRDDAMRFDHYNTRFTFYFDTYGNVIGCGPVTGDAVNYAVLDRIYGEHVKGKYLIKGDLYINGAMVEDATISHTAGSFKDIENAWDNEDFKQAEDYDPLYWITTEADRNGPALTDALYTYTVDDEGVYTLTWVGLWSDRDEYWDGFGRMDTEDDGFDAPVQHLAKRASLSVFYAGMTPVNLSESTKFICKGVDGTWKTYTGYTELPALTARYMDYVLEADDSIYNFASVVYLGEVVYAADKIVGYVPTWDAFRWADGYDVITVYVKGEAVKVNLKHEDQFPDVLRAPGMYEFEMAVDENGVSYAQIKRPLKLVVRYEGLIAQCIDKTAIVVNHGGALTPAIGLTGVKLYHVVGDTITEMAAADLVVGDYVVVYSEDGEITEIYVYDTKPTNPIAP